MCCCSVFVLGSDLPKRIFPTVQGLIEAGQASLSVAGRVLGFSRQAYYKWRAQPQSKRECHDQRLNVAWVVDITEHWTGTGKVYVCAIKDLCSRRIVGWAVDGRMTSGLAVEA